MEKEALKSQLEAAMEEKTKLSKVRQRPYGSWLDFS